MQRVIDCKNFKEYVLLYIGLTGGASAEDFQKTLTAISIGTIRKKLSYIKKEGLIRLDKEHRWNLTPKGRAYVEETDFEIYRHFSEVTYDSRKYVKQVKEQTELCNIFARNGFAINLSRLSYTYRRKKSEQFRNYPLAPIFGAEESLYEDGHPKTGGDILRQLSVGENYYLTRGTIRKIINTQNISQVTRENLSRVKGMMVTGTNVFYCYYLRKGFKDMQKEVERTVVQKIETSLLNDLSKRMYDIRKSNRQLVEAITFCEGEKDVYDILTKFPKEFKKIYKDNHIIPVGDIYVDDIIELLNRTGYTSSFDEEYGLNLFTMSSVEMLRILTSLQKRQHTIVYCFPNQVKYLCRILKPRHIEHLEVRTVTVDDVKENKKEYVAVQLNKTDIIEDIPDNITIDIPGNMERYFPDKYTSKSEREKYIRRLLVGAKKAKQNETVRKGKV